jgi:hypothetical protein
VNKASATLLILPIAAAFILGILPVQAQNPGNSLMTSSGFVFQSDAFELAGSAASLVFSEKPEIVTGRWSLEVQNGTVAGFSANLTMVGTDGTGRHEIELGNFTSLSGVQWRGDTATMAGTVDVAVNGTGKWSDANVVVTVARLQAVSIALDSGDTDNHFAGQPIFGIADPEKETVTADAITEGSGLVANNATEKLKLPQLPNPFR